MMARRHWWPALLLSSLAFSATAEEALAPVYDRTAALEAAKALESRVARLERVLENQALVEMLMRLDSLQSDTQELRGIVEELRHELDGIKQRQRDLYLDIDRRMRDLEQGLMQLRQSAAAAPAPAAGGPVAPVPLPTAPVAVAPVATTAEAAQIDPAAEQAAYQAAFEELKQGRYEEAIKAFEAFLRDYPNGEYAGNAQYWLGEANYVTRRFDVAEAEFKKVLERFPDSNKAADAMLKLGYTYYELARWEEARKTLEEVKRRFPDSTVARLAENRLQKMRMEGRF